MFTDIFIHSLPNYNYIPFLHFLLKTQSKMYSETVYSSFPLTL